MFCYNLYFGINSELDMDQFYFMSLYSVLVLYEAIACPLKDYLLRKTLISINRWCKF